MSSVKAAKHGSLHPWGYIRSVAKLPSAREVTSSGLPERVNAIGIVVRRTGHAPTRATSQGGSDSPLPRVSGDHIWPMLQNSVSPEWSSTPSLSVETQAVPSGRIASPSTLSCT